MNKAMIESKKTKSEQNKIPPYYTAFSDSLRQITPHVIQCTMFCGGSRCKYEQSDGWEPNSQAMQGIYSHWVTEDILAMSRPNTSLIAKKNIVQQFHGWGIKTIINLQTPGEHAHCGPTLESSGFAYDPTVFMANQVHFYNFAWKDYGEATLTTILDMVKVLDFAVKEGRVAIHCHAGLGRTGVLIACYLVYALRVRANDAIRYIRLKRPNSVQTRGQILCVQQFEQYILPQTLVFSHRWEHEGKDRKETEFNLKQYLYRQKVMLHGYEERTFKHLPKIIYAICERLLQLCNYQPNESGINYSVNRVPFTRSFLSAKVHSTLHKGTPAEPFQQSQTASLSSNTICSTRCSSSDGLSDLKYLNMGVCDLPGSKSASSNLSSISRPYGDDFVGYDDTRLKSILGEDLSDEDVSENVCFRELKIYKELQTTSKTESIQSYRQDDITRSLLIDHETLNDETRKQIKHIQDHFNFCQTSWTRINMETDINILTALLYDWLENLKVPILNRDDLSIIVIWGDQVEECILRLDLHDAYIIEYLLRFISRLQSTDSDSNINIIRRIGAALTQQAVDIIGITLPSGKDFTKLRVGTHGRLVDFLHKFLLLIGVNQE